MWHQKIVAVYDKVENAIEAARALRASGIPANDISLLSLESFGNVKVREPRIWRRLFGGNLGSLESAIYGRTVQAGGAVLTVRLTFRDRARAVQALDIPKPGIASERSTSLIAKVPPVRSNTALHVVAEDVLPIREDINESGARAEEGNTRVRRLVLEKPVDTRVTLHDEQMEIVRQTTAEHALRGSR